MVKMVMVEILMMMVSPINQMELLPPVFMVCHCFELTVTSSTGSLLYHPLNATVSTRDHHHQNHKNFSNSNQIQNIIIVITI